MSKKAAMAWSEIIMIIVGIIVVLIIIGIAVGFFKRVM